MTTPQSIIDLPLTEAFETLSRLLEYPTVDMPECRFTESMTLGGMSADEREEAYTATFDVTPACVPYVSIHLFGEQNFKRGAFMAELSGRCTEMGFDCRGELPDHLANMLRLAAKVGDEERRELMQFCVLGPVKKMMTGLGDGNPYRAILGAIEPVVQAAYPGLESPLTPLDEKANHGSCGTCPSIRDHDMEAALEPEAR